MIENDKMIKMQRYKTDYAAHSNGICNLFFIYQSRCHMGSKIPKIEIIKLLCHMGSKIPKIEIIKLLCHMGSKIPKIDLEKSRL
jgi:hypothetical protein